MDCIERIKNEHRDHWFKNHIARLEKHGDLMVLNWQKPGSSYHHIRYIFHDQQLYISGDCGEAVFQFTELADPCKINNYNLSYYIQKMCAYSGDKYNFNTKEAFKELDEWYKERINDVEDDKSQLKDLEVLRDLIADKISCSYDLKGYEHGVWSIYDYWSGDYELDTEELAIIAEFGQELSARLICHKLGLEMAIEQLDKIKTTEQ